MPRRPRNEIEGGIHHVYARGNDRQAVFRDDIDRRRYLGFLDATVCRHRWRCLSYCLMDNHVHLLVETETPTLGRGMQWLHGHYAAAFNRRHGRVGHLFQGRFGSTRVEDDPQLWMVLAYIARNPVAARLCATAEEWPWSSHAALAGHDGEARIVDTDRVWDFLAGLGGDGRTRYLEAVRGDVEAAA